MDGTPTRYAIVGRGWRAQFFLRLAALMPDRFAVTGVVTRDGAPPAAAPDVPAYRTPADAVAAGRPEFVVTAVAWDANPGLIETLVDLGVPVLAETPPAPDLDGLRRLWARVGASGQVQVAEQYLMLPDHAARLAVVRAGALGTPTSVQVSSTHGYHAVSIMRGLLDGGFGPAQVCAHAITAPLADPLARTGWRGDDTPVDATTTVAVVDFGDGRSGLYDFTANQWWNPLRTSRIVVRGSRGELVDDRLVRLVDPVTVVESTLLRRQVGRDMNLEGADLDHISFDGEVVYRNAFAGARLSDEDVAVATMLARTGAWCRDAGPPPYPLAEACQDHLVGLAITASATDGRPVETAREPWAVR